MTFRSRAAVIFILWVAVLAALGWYVQKDLVIGTDLRLFLPSPTTAEQRLLLNEIGEGPASRVLVVAIDGAEPEKLAETSRELVAALSRSNGFRLVTNGEMSLDDIPDELLAYRYLLSPTLDSQPLDAKFLHEQLLARERDLASPAGTVLEPLLPRDPTLELLKLLQSWQPTQEPNRLYDVWFDKAGRRALLIAETNAPAFDPDRQRVAIDELRQTFASLDGTRQMHLTVSGPGEFSVLMESRTRGEAQTLGVVATVGMLVLLLVAYRNIGSVIVSSLPLATAGVVGLLAVSLLFDAVHGITLAFGFTLIGVAQDYPMHLLSHAQPGKSPVQAARQLWPTLATGVASTCIAYATFLFSGVIGLAQLACFTVASLAAAGLTTRFLLPMLIGPATRDFGNSTFLAGLWNSIASLPRPRWAGFALVVVCIAVIALVPGPMWENDLSKLTPVPKELLLRDQQLRSELGTPDLRYLLVVEAADDDAALTQLDELDPKLRMLKDRGAINGYDDALHYLPTRDRQLTRQHLLPGESDLRAAVDTALQGTAFRADVFEPFVADVIQARKLPPLTVEQLRASPLGATFDLLLSTHEGRSTAIVTFTDVNDPHALRGIATSNGAILLDLKEASESLVARQRSHLLRSLLVAAIGLIVVVTIALRRRNRVLRVLAPMAITTLLLVAVLHGLSIPMTLFHLIALILAAGLGLDYALFFEHAAEDPHEQRRTLHAVLVCSLSTLMVFALLALSSLPVLQAIGITVSLGVVSNFVLALLLTREGRATAGTGTTAAQLSGGGPPPVARSPFSLIPHQGSMCLLERVVSWNDSSIQLTTDSHRSTDNPLRSDDRLKAIHLCEYGAQAMAVHGALRAQRSGGMVAPGMLVALRSVEFHCERIDDLPEALTIDAECLQSSASNQQYAFRIQHRNTLLCAGRAAVVLGQNPL